MNFDKTYIAIRKRNLLEILDLSLHVIRDRILSLSILWLIGCLPFIIFNWYWLRDFSGDYHDPEQMWLYVYLMTLLVTSQSHFASLFTTNYLGKSMFSESPSVWETIKSTMQTNLYFFWVHGCLRLVFPVMILACFLSDNIRSNELGMVLFWISVLVLIGLLVRAARPFATEILALEKTPVFKKPNGNINYSVRSRSLHKAASSELSGRFILVGLFSIPLTGVVLGSLLTIDSSLSLHSNFEFLPAVFYFPLALWIVSGILAVARFLSYIDIRIRQEGWEVELRIRSEALKLEKSVG